MSALFARYLEAGIFGSVIILFILLVRLLLRKVPRRFLCLLWLLAAIRLLVPLHMESQLSLQPDLDAFMPAVQQDLSDTVINVEIPDGYVPVIDNVQSSGSQQVNDTANQQPARAVDIMTVLSFVWLLITCAIIVYMVISYMILRFRVRTAVQCNDGVMECDCISSAFLLGYFRPKVYLSSRVSDADRRFVVQHERAHIANGDHWWKLLGFICVSLHWYNPLVWLGYVMLCRDIETACDEKVIQKMNLEERKAYSMALLNCGRKMSGGWICPVTFGEINLKQRIKNILSYKKPTIWITVLAIVLIVVVVVCFMTMPKNEDGYIEDHSNTISTAQDSVADVNGTGMSETDQPHDDGDALQDEQTESPSIDATEQSEATTQTEPETDPATEPTKPVEEPIESTEQPKEPEETQPATQPTPEPSAGNDLSQVTGSVPDRVLNGSKNPAEDTADHVHNYVAVDSEPLCETIGYTTYTCSCGHVYYGNFKSQKGHQLYLYAEKEATANYDGGTQYACENCVQFFWENFVPATYKTYDYEAMDQYATDYATSYGFQTQDSGPNSAAKEFKYSGLADQVVRYGGQEYLKQKAKQLVDQAYSYCVEKGYEVSQSAVWVEIYYSNCYFTIRVYCATV